MNTGNDTMKLTASIAKSMYTSRKFAEVPRGPRNLLIVKLEYNTPAWFLIHSDVKLSGGCESESEKTRQNRDSST